MKHHPKVYFNYLSISNITGVSCSSEELECVKKVEVNDLSNCLKPCSGLVVTSFTRSDPPSNLDILFPISRQYNKYKKITEHPVGYDGNN